VLGGGLGNMIDRALRDHGGGVVDFIDLSFWPTFNVADMAIVIGVVLVAISGFRGEPARAGT
jgi:signal peptidase II